MSNRFRNSRPSFHRHNDSGTENQSQPHISIDISSASPHPAARMTALNDDGAILPISLDTTLPAAFLGGTDQQRRDDYPMSISRFQSHFHGLSKATSVAWQGLETALRLLERSADAFPPLKSAVGGLVAILDLTEAMVENHEEYENIAKDLKVMAETLASYISKIVSSGARDQLAHIAKSFEDELESIRYKQDRRKEIRLVEANGDAGDILQRYRRIESLFCQVQMYISMRTAEDTRDSIQKSLLDDLSPVKLATYNSSYSTTIGRRGCTPETRETIIQDLKNWAMDREGTKVYWMNGIAGTGKTTIGYTFCEWLAEAGKLAGSFFCSRTESSCRDANTIIPTLAFQLSQFSPNFRSSLCETLKKDVQASKLEVRWQFQKLIEGPIREVVGPELEGSVIVVDALDECDDGEAFRLFLETLLKFAPDLPFKFFLTSRPEPIIWQRMMAPAHSRSVLHLHNIEEAVVEADIKKYLSEALHSMSPPPSPEQVGQLSKRAGTLFIYAATAVRYICPDRAVDSTARLNKMLGLTTGSGKHYEELDRLYTNILSAALDNDQLEDDEISNILLTLWTVVCAMEPVSLEGIASLLSIQKRVLQTSLEPLRSVLFIQEGVDGLIAPFHASFPDYILQRDRSKRFHCHATQHHGLLANGCFEVMRAQLRFNICNLESSFVFDEDVPDLEDRVKKHISRTLSYACRYWGEHLQNCNPSKESHENVNEFLMKRLLFWLEVLNLEKRISMGVDILRQARKGLKQLEDNEIKQITDAEAFVARFAGGACRRSTPHIYISAIPFCAKSSSVYANYWRYTRGLMEVKGSALNEWPSAAITVWKTGSEVLLVAFSPDGTRIVSGSLDKTIQVWDARSGDLVAGPFKGHTRPVMSVAFSPDSTCIVSGSGDKTIRVWDARSGNVVTGPFEGHTCPVTSVAFSPDGTRIVSGSDDQTIRVWDARSGGIVAGPFEGHTDSVTSVTFSPDGNRIVSGSSDETIRVWDAQSGDVVSGPFKAHASVVWSVAFSPDGTRIVAGLDDQTIRVWDARNGDIVAGPFKGHTDSVMSVALSPDGTCIVSGSVDETIRVWDAQSGNVVAGPFEGHARHVTSVAFSPDGTRIVSSSYDQTIRVWDGWSGDVAGSFKGHTSEVTSVAFSPDGTCIVSGSWDETIRVWDAQSGDVVPGSFEGHTSNVTSVAFSPDGTRIVSGSYDKTIRVWDARSGDIVAGPFEGHTDSVTSVAFSPDGTCIVSGSADETIRVWDAQSGNVVTGPFEGHTRHVTSVAFSPDGTRIVSGSYDKTIRVWDAQSGDVVAGPFKGHTRLITSVAFSPDGTHIVSGSVDETIRVWDAESGNVVAGPFRGHTSQVTSAAFSPDGTRIVSGSSDETVRVWDTQSGDIVAGPFEGHTDYVTSVAFSPDGTRIVSGSGDKTIRVWDAQSGNICFGLSRGCASIASGYSDQMIQKWDADFIFAQDGWITLDCYPFFWISPNFRSQLPFPTNTLVIGPQGVVSIDYLSPVNIGTSWTSCFLSPT